MKILLIEDETSLRDLIARALRNEGYVVEEAANYADAYDKLSLFSYDCTLLDIMLPDGNGIDLLKHFKAEGKPLNVIIISARDSIEDKVLGLEEGADDYLPKPFHTAELLARVKSVIRRSSGGNRNGLSFGNISINNDARTAEVNGRQLLLVKKEYDILCYFVMRPGHIVDKSVLAEAVWGDNIYLADNFDFIYSQVKNLRKKLEEAGSDAEIKSVYGFGYKLVIKDQQTKKSAPTGMQNGKPSATDIVKEPQTEKSAPTGMQNGKSRATDIVKEPQTGKNANQCVEADPASRNAITKEDR